MAVIPPKGTVHTFTYSSDVSAISSQVAGVISVGLVSSGRNLGSTNNNYQCKRSKDCVIDALSKRCSCIQVCSTGFCNQAKRAPTNWAADPSCAGTSMPHHAGTC